MSKTAPPTPQQLLQQPAGCNHTTQVTAVTSKAQLVDHIMASSDRYKRAIISDFVQSAAADVLARVTATVNNEQQARRRWNTLPSEVLSNVFSYLSTLQVIQLRRLSNQWDTIGQQTSSFNDCTDEGSILLIDKPGVFSLNGVRAVALWIHADIAQSLTTEDGDFDYSAVYNNILRCIANATSVDTLVSKRSPSDYDDDDEDAIYVHPCRLSDLYTQPSFVHRLRRIELGSSIPGSAHTRPKGEPLQSLVVYRSHLDAGSKGPCHDILFGFTRLIQNVQKLHMQYIDGTVMTLEPYLQRLPHLTDLSIDNYRWAFSPGRLAGVTTEQVVGTVTPKCRLLRLQITSGEQLHELLVESETIGLRDICADTVQHLVLHKMQYLSNFSLHLAQFTQLQQLELIYQLAWLDTADTYRGRLLETLKQLKHLRVLKLRDDSQMKFSGRSEVRIDHRSWSADDVTALLCLPLTELVVQHLAKTAGQALTALADADEHPLKKLALGVTNLDWEVVLAVAAKLEQLLLPSQHKPRAANSHRAKRAKTVALPASIDFYDEWDDDDY